MKVLLAADGSKCAMHAVRHVITNFNNSGPRPQIHLVHVQPPLSGRATAVFGHTVVHDYYREQSEKALSRARRALARSGVKYKEVHLLGDPGTTIAAYAKQQKIPLVLMGSHGHGALPGVVLGSVARKVLAHCGTPALIIH